MSPLLLQSLTAFFATLLGVVALSRVAPTLGLTDKPSGRKLHRGEIPMVGGIAIFMALSLAALVWGESNQSLITVNGNDALPVFMACGAFLVLTGALDDRFHLGVFMRVLSEVLVALAVIEFLDLRVAHLGDLAGSGTLSLSPMIAYPFTVVAIFGIINAFNMLDGMDGLLALLVITTLVTFHLFTETAPGFVTLAISASLLAFLVSNLGLSPLVPKTFLGDAGSKLLGFIVVCLLLAAASGQVGKVKLVEPVTALFIVALPLFDMVFTTLRRLIRKGSPFAADRSHIHHLMQVLGFSDRRALVIILGIHLSVTFIGLMLHRANTPEYFQFGIFLGCFGLYSLLSSQLWLVAYRLKEASPSISVKFNADGSLHADGSLPATEIEALTPEPVGTDEISNITPLRKND
jgi:UDP-GlcNAc:undecaprenyl-phosphate GlcNAc-1-phosphate transferase